MARLRNWIAVIGLLACPEVMADPLPALTPLDQHIWRAVGIVNTQGANGVAACTGTLVAADLVLTAAHCVWGDEPRFFVVDGLTTGTAYPAREIMIHPEYTKAPDVMARYAVDLALMRLQTPVQDVPPLRAGVYDPASVPNAPFALLGFHRMRPGALNGRYDCAATPGSAETLRLRCHVISGNSGGPVLTRNGNDWLVIGIAVATLGGAEAKQALVAILDDWVRTAR